LLTHQSKSLNTTVVLIEYTYRQKASCKGRHRCQHRWKRLPVNRPHTKENWSIFL